MNQVGPTVRIRVEGIDASQSAPVKSPKVHMRKPCTSELSRHHFGTKILERSSWAMHISTRRAGYAAYPGQQVKCDW